MALSAREQEEAELRRRREEEELQRIIQLSLMEKWQGHWEARGGRACLGICNQRELRLATPKRPTLFFQRTGTLQWVIQNHREPSVFTLQVYKHKLLNSWQSTDWSAPVWSPNVWMCNFDRDSPRCVSYRCFLKPSSKHSPRVRAYLPVGVNSGGNCHFPISHYGFKELLVVNTHSSLHLDWGVMTSPNRMWEGTYTQELMLQIHLDLMGMLHSQGRMKKNANVWIKKILFLHIL